MAVTEQELERLRKSKRLQRVIDRATKSFSAVLSPEERAACGLRALWKTGGMVSREGFDGYLWRAVRNECIDELRDRNRPSIPFLANASFSYTPDLSSRLIYEEIVAASSRLLNSFQQSVFQMYFVEHLSVREIALVVQKNRATIYGHLNSISRILNSVF